MPPPARCQLERLVRPFFMLDRIVGEPEEQKQFDVPCGTRLFMGDQADDYRVIRYSPSPAAEVGSHCAAHSDLEVSQAGVEKPAGEAASDTSVDRLNGFQWYDNPSLPANP